MMQWIKRLFDRELYTQASVRVFDNMGDKGSAYPPFNYQVAVREFRSWVYAAAWINASAVAATPLRLYVRRDGETKSLWRTRSVNKKRHAYLTGDGAGHHHPSRTVMRKVLDLGEEYEEVTEMHPVMEMLQKANHVYNGFDLTILRTLYQELTGNAYMHPVIDPTLGIPTELWPMPSQWVQIIPDREQFIDGYVYGRSDVESVRFEVDEVIHFKRPNPDNLFYGLGKVEAAYGVVKANRAVHDMDLATFENHARPDYAVVVNGPHRRADLDVFEQHVTERLRGTRKSGQFLTVSGDVKFEPLNFPPKDLGGREEIVEEIAAVFGVPVSMLKANDPNLASARAGFAQWRESTILPMLRMDEDVLNQVLLPMFGIEGDACLAYDNPVPADTAFELSERQASVAGGWMSLNEARLEQGMSESENPYADELLFNGQPLGTIPEPMDPFGAMPMPMQMAEPPQRDEPEEDDPYRIDSIKSVLQSVASCELSTHAAITLCKRLGYSDTEAEEVVLSQARLAMDVNRKQAVEPTTIDLYATPEEAEARAAEIGCSGHHTHEGEDGTTLYMPCLDMDEYTALTGLTHAKQLDIRRDEEELLGNRLPFHERLRRLLDLNGDGAVNELDLEILINNFGGAGLGDFNGDGIVDGLDLKLWIEYMAQYGGQYDPLVDKEKDDDGDKWDAPHENIDTNGDGVIDQGEWNRWMQRWKNGFDMGDLNDDGVVDDADYDIAIQMLEKFGGEDVEPQEEVEIEKLIGVLADLAESPDRPDFTAAIATQFAAAAQRGYKKPHPIVERLRVEINRRRGSEASKPSATVSGDTVIPPGAGS
tara:strand:+ start:9031 stop:11493 length:2463 start_codon:yes stop_codon:yes gene_type:complete